MKTFKVYGLADITNSDKGCKIQSLDIQNSYGENLSPGYEKMVKGFLQEMLQSKSHPEGTMMFTLKIIPFMNKSQEVKGQDAQIEILDCQIIQNPPLDHEEAFAYQSYQYESVEN